MVRRGSVLVIDDDRSLRALIRSALEEEGYWVHQAANGLEGLKVLAQHTPDIILLDMRMPVIDGLAFARELRAHYGSRLPVVLVTAATDAEKRAQQVGAAEWLVKPFELNELVSTVNRLLGSRMRAA